MAKKNEPSRQDSGKKISKRFLAPKPETKKNDAGDLRKSTPQEIDLFVSNINDNSADIFAAIGITLIPEPEFTELTDIILREFGIRINHTKQTLLTGRIHPILVQRSLKNHREYIELLKADQSGQLLSELANRISTNHTAFFREEAHFTLLMNKILPELIRLKTEQGDKDLRIWSAACSTGEEAYTLEMCLRRHLGTAYKDWRAGVLATDISAAALKVARAGRYADQKIEVVPQPYRQDFFSRCGPETYEVDAKIRSEVTFRRLNLIRDAFPFKKPFDIIFCRNVMIYFDQSTRDKLIGKMYEITAPGGYLFIGHSESIINSSIGYNRVAPAVYYKKKRRKQ